MAANAAFYTLLLDGNARRFALVSLKKKAAPKFQTVPKEKPDFASAVRSFLEKKGVLLSQISLVQVKQGKGSFSDTRSVVLLANLLANFAQIPVRVLSPGGRWIFSAPEDAKSFSMTPRYYAEPNITAPK